MQGRLRVCVDTLANCPFVSDGQKLKVDSRLWRSGALRLSKGAHTVRRKAATTTRRRCEIIFNIPGALCRRPSRAQLRDRARRDRPARARQRPPRTVRQRPTTTNAVTRSSDFAHGLILLFPLCSMNYECDFRRISHRECLLEPTARASPRGLHLDSFADDVTTLPCLLSAFPADKRVGDIAPMTVELAHPNDADHFVKLGAAPVRRRRAC